MNNLIETLWGIDLLKGISEEEFLQIGTISEEVEFAEGGVIFRENTPAENL